MITSLSRALVGRPNLVTAPTLEPVALADFYDHARLSTDYNQDTKIEGFLTAARMSAEHWTGRAFCPQQWSLTFDVASGLGGPFDDFWYTGSPLRNQARYLPRVIELPRPPLISVESVVWYDEDDNETAISTDDYRVSTSGTFGRLSLKSGRVWPAGMREVDSLVITFWCGYGTVGDADADPPVEDTETVPQAVKEAILEWSAHMYENREGQQAANAGGAVVLNRGSFIPAGVQTKLTAYRVIKL